MSFNISFVDCHIGAAEHFEQLAKALEEKGHRVQIIALGPAVDKLKHLKNFSSYDLKDAASLEAVALKCKNSSFVITDVGDSFCRDLHSKLQTVAPRAFRLAYYDNPETFVPGGYSKTAASVMQVAHGVLFANASLANQTLFEEKDLPIDLSCQKKIGIGYYTLAQIERVKVKRVFEKQEYRQRLFVKWDLAEKNQKIFTYFGGNNTVYFENAFPAFLKILGETISQKDLSNIVLILQQHPAAKKGSNQDGKQMNAFMQEYCSHKNAPQIIISDESTEDMLTLADAAFYYQTSMGPLFSLCGILPIQIGHETYEDVLVRNKLCQSITNKEQFLKVLDSDLQGALTSEKEREIKESLGIRENWKDYLLSVFDCKSL